LTLAIAFVQQLYQWNSIAFCKFLSHTKSIFGIKLHNAKLTIFKYSSSSQQQQHTVRMVRVKAVAKNISCYRTPPTNPKEILDGLVICFCGTLSMSRVDFEHYLISHGADVYSTITKNTTHLIATQEEVEKQSHKVKRANASRVLIVKEEFVHECVRNGVDKVDVTKFILNNATTTTTIEVENNKRKRSNHGEEDYNKTKMPRIELTDEAACVS
jgi:hypothetical protein